MYMYTVKPPICEHPWDQKKYPLHVREMSTTYERLKMCVCMHIILCSWEHDYSVSVHLREVSAYGRCLLAMVLHVYNYVFFYCVSSYGSVFKAMHKESGQVVAIKQVPVDTDLQEIIKEISMMQQCDR